MTGHRRTVKNIAYREQTNQFSDRPSRRGAGLPGVETPDWQESSRLEQLREQLIAEKQRLEERLWSLKTKIAVANRKRLLRGVQTDGYHEWHDESLKIRIRMQEIQNELRALREEQRAARESSFPGAFLETARRILPKEVFGAIAHAASVALEAKKLSPSDSQEKP